MKRIIRIPTKVLRPIRDYLLHEQQKLLKRKDKLRQEDPFIDQERINDNADIGQEATEQWGHQRVEALKTEIDKGLIRIRQTLTRIKIGKYGLCSQCGKMINTDRLAIDPTAELCISCQKSSSSSDGGA